MSELYLPIRTVHITAVVASGSLFLLRGLLVQAGRQALALARPLRYVSYAIDTVLLASAVSLSVIVRQYPFVHAWLTVKVLLIVAYIGLGTFALKRGRSARVRAACFVLALAVFAFIVTVARTHHPWGVFARAADSVALSANPV